MDKVKSKITKIMIWVCICLLMTIGFFVGRRVFTKITYSNLTSTQSLEAIKDLLKTNGVPETNIEMFSNQVVFTNEYLKDLPGLQSDFVTKRGSVVSYDENAAFNLFIKVILPEDLNCRIAAWNIVKDIIHTNPLEGEIEYSEQSILEYYPYTGFEEGEDKEFWSVFKGIETHRFHTIPGYAKIIQEEWEKRGVQFTQSNISLISCFAYANDNQWIEAVHAGVMIEEGNQVIFIEKYNPKAPFQVSVFNNEKELKYYLKQRLIGAFILNPIIMKNNNLL